MIRCSSEYSVPWLEVFLIPPGFPSWLVNIHNLLGVFDGLEKLDDLSCELLSNWTIGSLLLKLSEASEEFLSESFKSFEVEVSLNVLPHF